MFRKVDRTRRKPYIEKDSEEDTRPIKIGHHYLVERKANEWVKAEVIRRRFNRRGNFMEYYVHYNSLNRRLDEWVRANRIILHNNESNDEPESCEESRRIEPSASTSQSSLTPLKTSNEENNAAEDVENDDAEKELAEITKVKYINTIQLGIYEIDTWYFSPYPEEYGEQEKLFICEYCLKYMKLEETYRYHLGQCSFRAPPGNEIYRKGTLTIHEVDPLLKRLYCQNLCLLAKLFIDHKTIFFDVDQFLFYVLCEVDNDGAHIRGYFSKEKESSDGYNLACLLILPPFQKLGYGKLLIGFSYELSKLEGVAGTPEKPISDLAMLSYRSYWCWVLLEILKEFQGSVSISHLSEITSIAETDIIDTLGVMNLLKYWDGLNTVCVSPALVESHISFPQFKRPRLTVDPNKITWRPYHNQQSSSDDDDRNSSEELDNGNNL